MDETSQSVHSEDEDGFGGRVCCGGGFKIRLGNRCGRNGKFGERSVGTGK